MTVGVRKIESLGYRVALGLPVLTQYRPVTDRQMDGQTTHNDSKYRANIASHGQKLRHTGQ